LPDQTKQTKTFACSRCKREFPNNKELGKHRWLIHHIPGKSNSAKARAIARAAKEGADPDLTCTLCTPAQAFRTPLELGKHKRFKHGIQGTSHSAARSRAITREGHVNEPQSVTCDLCGRGPFNSFKGLVFHRRLKHGISTPRQNALATLTPERNDKHGNPQTTNRGTLTTNQPEVEHHLNGSSQHQGQYEIPEATLAVAFGRFTELCRTIAVEYDLPPRLFAHRLSELIHSAQVRQSSRRAV
jgi:hypothetical protein